MKNFKKQMKAALLASLFLTVSAAHAAAPAENELGFTIEPYAGWGLLGNLSISASGSTNSLATFNGFATGAMAKVRFMRMYFAGVDFTWLPSITGAPNSSQSLATATTFNSYKFGLLAGATLPVFPISFWVGYNFLDAFTSNVTGGNSNTANTFNGGSLKLGVGYRVFQYLAVNAQYSYSFYSSQTTGGSTQSLSSGAGINSNLLLLTASVPVDINL